MAETPRGRAGGAVCRAVLSGGAAYGADRAHKNSKNAAVSAAGGFFMRRIVCLGLSAALLAGCSAQAGEAARAQPSPAPSPRAAEAGADLYPTLEIAQAAGYAVHAEESDDSDSPQGYAAPAVEVAYFFTREGDANGADVSLVLEGEEERLVRCSHGNGPAPDHVCESAWLDGTLYQGADCLTAMFGEGALDAAAD